MTQWIMAATGVFALIISAWAVWLVNATLRANQDAAAEAKRSADAAIDAADTSRASVEIAQDTAKRQLRAYLLPFKAQVYRFESGANVEVRVFFKNTGQTPAYKVEQVCAVRSGPYPATFGFDVPSFEDRHRTIVGAGEGHTTIISAGEFSVRAIEEIRSGRAAIWAWGWLKYEDIFGDTHKTRFRFAYGGPIGAHKNGGMGADGEDSNDAD